MEQAALLLTLRACASEIGMKEVCRRSGLTEGTLYRVLRASGNPRLSTLSRVCEALDVKMCLRTTGNSASKVFHADTIL